MGEWFSRVKTYLSFTKEELLDLVISIAVFSFIFYAGNRDEIGIVSSFLIIALSFLFHVTAQKIAALKVGYKVEYKISWYAILIIAVLAFVSGGKLWWLIVPGGITFTLLAGLRLGKFRYGLNFEPMGLVALVGPVASILLGTAFMNVNLFFLSAPNILFQKIFIFNLAYAVSQMLPIPPLDGHYTFYGSRLWYSFLFGTILTYTLLAVLLTKFSWIFALVGGGIVWLAYYASFERKLW